MNFPEIPTCPVESEHFSLLLLIGSKYVFAFFTNLIYNNIIIKNSNSFINQEECQCARTCMVTVYDAIIEHMNRLSKIPPTRKSQLLLYFTSKGVTYSVEQSLYDFVQYMADLGGSLAFYIGLSMFTFMKLIDKV